MPTLTKPTITTAEQLFSQPSDGYRYELIAGELRMMSPAGGRHGRIASRIALLIGKHIEPKDNDPQGLGIVFAAETGFLIAREPDTVLAPDVAFVERSRCAEIEDEINYIPLAPDLVVEVLSPSDRFTRVESKVMAWLDAGTKIVLVVDPEQQMIHCYRSPKKIEIYRNNETIDCHDAVPRWNLRVKDAFKLY